MQNSSSFKNALFPIELTMVSVLNPDLYCLKYKRAQQENKVNKEICSAAENSLM